MATHAGLSAVAAAAKAGTKRRRAPSNEAGPALFEDGGSKHVSLRNRIRSMKRLLAKGNIPVSALKDKARLLRKMEAQLVDNEFAEKERVMGARYHGVKFFERKKAERALTQTERALAAATAPGAPGDADVPALQARLRQLQEEVIYIKWYPRHLKYYALYAKSERPDPKLDLKRARVKRWALANAAAGDFLRTPPSEDAALDVDAIVATRMPRLRSKRRKAAAAAAAAAGGDAAAEGEDDVSDDDDVDDDLDDDDGDEEEEEEDVKVQNDGHAIAPPPAVKKARVAAPAAAAPRAATLNRPARAIAPAVADDDRISEGSDAEGMDAVDAAADLAADAFFASEAPAALPQFHEETADATGDGDAPAYEVMGPQSTRARWEREHLHEKRYRDRADDRGNAARWRERAEQPVVPSREAEVPAPDFSHLSDRKRRRAERALAYARTRDEKAGGALLPGSGRYKEAFYGTEMDAGARLKSSDKLRRAAAHAAPRHQAARSEKPYVPSRPPMQQNAHVERSQAPAAGSSKAVKPKASKPGAHLKFID